MKNFKKVIAILLVNIMLLSTLPLDLFAQGSDNPNTSEPAMAAQSDEYGSEPSANSLAPGLNKPNAGEQLMAAQSGEYGPQTSANSLASGSYNPNAKEELMAALSSTYGSGTAAAMCESMISMGIIDENGNRITYKIELDGRLYTLDQMREIVNAPDVDLGKEVKVDDTIVTLAFIAELINFEEYITFVEENFLKNRVNVSDEHLRRLADLERQLNSEGISLVTGQPEPAADAEKIDAEKIDAEKSNAEKSDAEKVYPRAIAAEASPAEPAPVPIVGCEIGPISKSTADITYTLSRAGDKSSVTFTQEYLPGVLGEIAESVAQTITLSNSVPTKTVTINLPNIDKKVLWNGNAPVCYVRLNNLSGGLFANGESSQLIPVVLKGEYGFGAYTGQKNLLTNPVPNNNLNGWTVENAYWNNGDYGGEIKGNPSKKVTAWQDVPLNADAISLAANGELTVSASGFFWGQASSTMTASLDVVFYNQDGVSLGHKDQKYKKYTVGKNTTTLSFSGQPVPAGTTSMRLIAVNDNSLTRGPAMRNFSLTLKDTQVPTVQEIGSPAKTFKAGEPVPLVVTFSEPIVQDRELTLTMKDANGKTYEVKSKNTGLIHSKITFMFDIPPQTPINLWPVSISAGAKDTSNNLSQAHSFPNDVAHLATTFAYNELDSLVGVALKHSDGSLLTTGAYLPDETRGELEVNLFQSTEPTIDDSTVGQKQNEWLISHTTPEDNKFKVNRLYASYDNGATKIPLYITDALDKLTAEFGLPQNGGTYKMLLYLASDAAGTEFRPIMEAEYSVNFVMGTMTLVKAEEMTINYPASYPSGNDKVLYLGDEEPVTLTYTYSGDATFQNPGDFKWVSSDEKIAAISATGVITPMGVGKVIFKLVAMNGTADGTRDVTLESAEFSVQASLDQPSLAVSKFITTKQGEPAQVMWSTNVIYINQQAEPKIDTIFKVELYEGNFATVSDLAEKEPIFTADTEVDANSFTLPGDKLTRLSIGPEPAYSVKISTDNPYVPGQKVEALGNIIVTISPAKVILARPASYYILDTAEPLTVSWESINVNDTPGGCDFRFEVIKNQESLTTSQDPSGSYPITFGNVTGKLKDVYTVTAKIKNTGDDAYSYDSFVLHVYDAEAMKIWVNNQDVSTITMDNAGTISGLTSAEIVALERNISLTNKLSINYGDYSYGLVTDQIEWKSSDSGVASINYSKGGGYNNIEDYGSASYMPDTNFILAGLKDGTTSIDATHKLSRMTDTLGVEVKTLKDKLYLFQAMPLAKTEFIYTNGDGQEKTVFSDDNGAVAIYEPNGIKGDVNLKSTAGDSTYLGTIYQANLLSGENDGSKGRLYPINNFVLRKAAQMDLNFKNPDGTPYTGKVTIRGGVYKNGNYCETSEISDNAGVWKPTITIKPDKGFYRQEFDITRFWSAKAGETSQASVDSTDKIDYVFEFHFGDDDYQPQLSKFSGNLSGADVLRFGDSVVNLVSIAPADKNKPFFAAQYLDRYKKSGRLDNIKNATGNIGLNAQTLKIRIDTQALWWGAPIIENSNLAISILNEKGAALSGQNYRTFRYPFGTMLVTEHQIVIDANNIWVDKKGRGKLTVKLFNEDGTLYNSTLAPYSIRNMLEVENVSQSPDINERFQAELKKSIRAGASFEASDKFAQKALDFASGIQFGNDNFSIMLAPTADPTVFNGILQLTVGEDVMDMGPEEDEFSLMLDDDEVDSLGAGKAAFNRSRELASGLMDDLDSLSEDAKDSQFTYQVGGYFSCRVAYNFELDRWEIRPIGGGIRAGIGYQYSKVGNQFIGYIPVTYEVALGAAVRLEFDAHMLYEPVSVSGIDYYWQAGYESVTDYRTNLRIKAFIYAFGGLGFDATIVALKVGVFGQLELENENKFLNRNYLDTAIANQPAGYNQTEKALSGSRLSLQGQVGIKFVAKLLFITYKKTFASVKFSKEWTYRNWDKIEAYWEETTGDMLTMQNMSLATRLYAAATGQDTIVISEAPQLESRDYLNDYTRAWDTSGGRLKIMSLDPNNLAPSTLQSNAYPYADPLIADDGSMFVYLSDNNSPDVWDTTASYAFNQAGSYADKGTIHSEAESFGDSQLSFDSNKGLAISAWVRLTDRLDKHANDELTTAEMSMMTNNTEVYASIYRGGLWTTERLTSNTTPDMAPVVATNGSQAIAAWRSVYAGDAANPTDFSGKDTIVYRIYNGNNWSETKTLYNGVSGGVVGLGAAMTADGTATISYIIDTSQVRDVNSYEVVYGVVAHTGEIVKNVRLTNDDTADQSPQLTVAEFDGEERFVLGWYKTDGEKSDIRLATFSNDGNPKEDFVDSLYAVSSTNNIGGNFKFVNTSEANQDFKNLSILWTERNASTASDSLKAIKFMQETIDETKLTFTSAAVDVAEMPDKTVIDSFDAYVSDAANDEVKVIILGTESKDELETIIDTDEDGNPVEINVPKTESKMFTATEAYQNKAEITAADFNFTEIRSGFILPIAFTVQNQGKELITSVTIEYGTEEDGTESKTFTDLKVLPGTSHTLIVSYRVPENIADLSYRGTATFGDTPIVMAGNGTLPLAVADVGIARIDTVKEKDGQRELAVTLYNGSDYKLNTSGKTVKLGIYDNSAYTTGTEVVPMVIISDPDELFLIDNGAFITNLSFDIKSYLETKGKSEIPASGVTLYAKAWVADSVDAELAEFVGENNFSTILCANLVKRNNGNSIKVDVKQSNSATETTAVLTLQNLAMKEVTNGNVAVNLLDEGGNILKTQYLSNTAESLVTLGSEAVISKTFVFDTLGADVEAYYFKATADSMNADLQTLAASGVGVGFDKDTTTYDNLSANGLESTNVTAISANPKAKVVLKDASNLVLAEETGAVAYTLPLAAGSNTFKVTVEPDGAGAQPKTYALTVANAAPASGSVTLSTSAPGIRGWWNSSSVPVTLTATGLTNFTPTKMQYNVNNGDWTNRNYTGSPVDVTAITAEGTHVVWAKLQDVKGYNLTANSLTVKVDRTVPAFVADKTAATLAGNTLTVSADVTDALSGIYSVVMTSGGMDYPMQKQGNTDTYTANITADSVGAITIVAIDMAGNTAQTDIGNNDPGNNDGDGGSSNIRPKTSTITVTNAQGALSTATSGDIIGIDMQGKTDLPLAILNAIKGKDITVVLDMGDYSWQINGQQVNTTGQSVANYDLRVTKISDNALSKLAENTDIAQLELAFNGALPFTATLNINVGAQQSGKRVFMSYYNEAAKRLEYRTSAYVDSNGNVKFDFNHASKYVLNTQIVEGSYVKEKPNKGIAEKQQTGNGGLFSFVPYLIENDKEIIIKLSSTVDDAVAFKAPKTGIYGFKDNTKSFTDTSGHWAKDLISFITAREIFSGIGNGQFDPNGNMTRAMFVTALSRLDEADLSGYTTSAFSDVDLNAWYGKAVAWATNKGIVGGYSNKIFAPNDNITREQMSVILYRYAQHKGYEVTATNELTSFTDGGQTSSYAKEALGWAVGAGLVSGKGNGILDPQGNAQRAEVAAILKRFIENAVQ